jgi:LAS superfamily LD-carboxypeptidase LdcB
MRVLEPHHFLTKKPRRQQKSYVITGLIVLVTAAAGAGAYHFLAAKKDTDQKTSKPAQTVISTKVVAPRTLAPTPKVLTPNQFRDLYRRVLPTYPNTDAFIEMPTITGNVAADAHIREQAEKRGFQATRLPVSALIKTDEPLLKGETDDLLQPLAFQSWQALKATAKKEGIPLALYSAYRSPDWQRDLFMGRFTSNGGSPTAVAAGYGDAAVITTLGMTAVPGYSRHHTGYTVDFWCDDGTGLFGSSVCNKWLTENNYLHAKEQGWIPSYPAGADEQGPEPEPWEYVWVGKENLY